METKISRVLSPSLDGDHEYSSKSAPRKKLKLFGFELDPYYKPGDINISSNKSLENTEESVNSSTISFEGKKSSNQTEFQCPYCFKKFSNSQALGGHQNAHKKERMKKKRLQGNKASNITCYYPNKGMINIPFIHDPSSYEESQICFSRVHSDQDFRLSYGSNFPIQRNSSVFTLTHIDGSKKRSCKTLDLDLVLGLNSSVGSSSRYGT